MPIYKGNQEISDIYVGGTKIDSIYKGSQLVWTSAKPYPAGTVIFESSVNGTYTVNIPAKQTVYIELVGGGGGGRLYSYGSTTVRGGGGSGAYVKGTMLLNRGDYSVVVGGGGNYSDTQQSGYNGTASTFNGQRAGFGYGHRRFYDTSTSSYIARGGTYTITEAGLTGVEGITGDGNSAGASVYNNSATGYGAGGYLNNRGQPGYVKIVAQ